MPLHEYSFHWTPSVYVRATHAISRHMRGPISLIPMLFTAAFILFLAALASTDSPGAPWALFGCGAFSILFASYLYWGAPWFRARRVLREDPCAQDGVRHTIAPEAFFVRTSGVAVEVKWGHIVQVVETPEFLLFYFNKRGAYFTPKRVIPENDLPTLRASLLHLVGDRARLAHAP